MIAAASDGSTEERFLDVPGVATHKYGFAQWGNQWTVYIYPRRDILELVRKAKERGIYVALSTWLKPTWSHENDFMEGPQGLVRIWDETLRFLEENGCLDNIIYVDVQNEIPDGGCNTWLYNQLACLAEPNQTWSARQKAFYRQYFNQVLRELKRRWPQLSFAASFSFWFWPEVEEETDLSLYDFLDVHLWADMAPCQFLKDTGYWEYIVRFGDPDRIYLNMGMGNYVGNIKRMPGDFHFEEINRKVHESWAKHKAECTAWLEEKVAKVAEIGRKYGIPVGNTEGWGSVNWYEHPMLSWDMVKEAAVIGAELGAKYGYLFNCQSNYCEPQYLRNWRDVEHHLKVTSIIRGKNKTCNLDRCEK